MVPSEDILSLALTIDSPVVFKEYSFNCKVESQKMKMNFEVFKAAGGVAARRLLLQSH